MCISRDVAVAVTCLTLTRPWTPSHLEAEEAQTEEVARWVENSLN